MGQPLCRVNLVGISPMSLPTPHLSVPRGAGWYLYAPPQTHLLHFLTCLWLEKQLNVYCCVAGRGGLGYSCGGEAPERCQVIAAVRSPFRVVFEKTFYL